MRSGSRVLVWLCIAIVLAVAGVTAAAPNYVVGDLFVAIGPTQTGRISTSTADYVFTSNGPATLPAWKAAAATGAPSTADYLVKTSDGGLSAERVVTDTTSITWDWGTAGQAKAARAALTGDVTASANSNSVQVDQARGLRETAGPTTLAMGAVTDGEFLKRSGSTIVSAPAAGTGTVTSVGLSAPSELSVAGSPVVAAGTLALSWATEAANKVFAGPTTGADATPTFRSLVAADIPSLSTVYQPLATITESGDAPPPETFTIGQLGDGEVLKRNGTAIDTVAILGLDYLVKTAAGGLSAERVVGDSTSVTANWVTAGAVSFERAALTGDVTASANSNATTIANSAVTYAKMQDVSATDKVLGRATAGAGVVEELPCTSAGRLILAGADAAAQRSTLALDRYFGSVTGDQNLSSTTFTDITSMSGFALAAGSTYYIDVNAIVTSNATTVGIQISPNASAAVTSINMNTTYPTSATAWTSERISALQGGTLPTAGPGATITQYRLAGFVVTSGAVTFAMQFKSETGAQVTIKAGSTCYIARVN